MSLFRTEVIGRLTKDPVVREVTIKGEPVKVANITLACDEDFGDGTDFVDVVLWRREAENAEKYLGKGRLVYAEGRMKKRTYEASLQGNPEIKYPRDVWELNNARLQYLDRAPREDGPAPYTPSNNATQASTASHSGPAPF